MKSGLDFYSLFDITPVSILYDFIVFLPLIDLSNQYLTNSFISRIHVSIVQPVSQSMASDHDSNAGTFCGDAVVILLPETDHQPAREIAKRIRASIVYSPVVTDRGLVSVLISMGVTQITPATADWVA